MSMGTLGRGQMNKLLNGDSCHTAEVADGSLAQGADLVVGDSQAKALGVRGSGESHNLNRYPMSSFPAFLPILVPLGFACWDTSSRVDVHGGTKRKSAPTPLVFSSRKSGRAPPGFHL